MRKRNELIELSPLLVGYTDDEVFKLRHRLLHHWAFSGEKNRNLIRKLFEDGNSVKTILMSEIGDKDQINDELESYEEEGDVPYWYE